jgi:hypothetical protein
MDRAQAHTVEAFVASMILIAGLLFATQATAVTPLSASTSNQHVENQQRGVADSLLAAADERGDLREAVLYWNATNGTFSGVTRLGFYTTGPPNAFGDSLNRTFGERRIAFNVRVRYHRPDGSLDSVLMVYAGQPSDNAVSASRTVPLFDTDRLTAPGATRTLNGTSSDEFYAADVGDGRLYNYAEVTVVVWRM